MDRALSFDQLSGNEVLFQIVTPLREVPFDDFLLFLALLAGGIAYLSRGKLWDKPDPYHQKWFERPQELSGSALPRLEETNDISKKLNELVWEINGRRMPMC